MSNQLLREALEEMVRCAQKQNWRDNYPSAMAKAYSALDATKEAPPAAAHGDEAVPADLKARCREIAQWRKSGVLRGDALRKYAESRWPGDPSALQMAEHETATEAFQVVSAMRAQAGEGGE